MLKILDMPLFRSMKSENSEEKNNEIKKEINSEMNNQKIGISKNLNHAVSKSDSGDNKNCRESSIDSKLPKRKRKEIYSEEMKHHYLNDEKHQEFVARFLERFLEKEISRSNLHASFGTVSG